MEPSSLGLSLARETEACCSFGQAMFGGVGAVLQKMNGRPGWFERPCFALDNVTKAKLLCHRCDITLETAQRGN